MFDMSQNIFFSSFDYTLEIPYSDQNHILTKLFAQIVSCYW